MATEVEVHVNVHVHDGVGLIQLNRPEKMNAIGALTRKQLGEAIKQVERDDAVRVVVLTGTGRAFCSGADVTQLPTTDGGMRTPEDVGNVLRTEYMPMLTRLRTMPKPVIAAMNGPAAGIGASYALACDIRIATPGGHRRGLRDVLQWQATVGDRCAPARHHQPAGAGGPPRSGGARARRSTRLAAPPGACRRQACCHPRARVELRGGTGVRVVLAGDAGGEPGVRRGRAGLHRPSQESMMPTHAPLPDPLPEGEREK